MSFDKSKFEHLFFASLEKIQSSENVTKRELRDVSRTVLEAWHATGNVMYINRLLKALTPVNKKAMVAFAKHFSGFSYDDVLGEFTHKSKKRYDKAHKECIDSLKDPHFNLWTWAERHIELAVKPFEIDSVEKYIKNAMNKAAGVGLSEVDILKAVFRAGVKPEAIIQVMDEMGMEFAEVEEIKPAEVSPF